MIMSRVCAAVSIAGIVVALLSVSGFNGFAQGTAEKTINLSKIYFMIHPGFTVSRPELRWRFYEAVDKMREDEALVIYPAPPIANVRDNCWQELLEFEVFAMRKLGRRLVLCGYPTTAAEFVELAEAQGLTYDPQTVEAEGWGEAFSACVVKHCMIISKQLGLTKPIAPNFAMCQGCGIQPSEIFSSYAVRQKAFVAEVTLPSQIRFYLFESEDGQPAAIFFECFRELDDPPRWVDIPLDPTTVAIYNPLVSSDPMPDIATPDGTGVRLPVSVGHRQHDPPQECVSLYGKAVDLPTFRAALMQARLVE